MAQILVKGELGETLSNLTDRSELRNENGEFLGLFLPAKFNGLPIFNDISEEELQRRSQQPGKCTLAEIWKSLGVT